MNPKHYTNKKDSKWLYDNGIVITKEPSAYWCDANNVEFGDTRWVLCGTNTAGLARICPAYSIGDMLDWMNSSHLLALFESNAFFGEGELLSQSLVESITRIVKQSFYAKGRL